MRFLIDNALSPLVSEALRDAGFDAVHVRETGLQAEDDMVVFEKAIAEDRILDIRRHRFRYHICPLGTFQTVANPISTWYRTTPSGTSEINNGKSSPFDRGIGKWKYSRL